MAAIPSGAKKVGEHKWDDCQAYSGKVYTDARVGSVWKFRSPGDATRAISPHVLQCDKCAKVFTDIGNSEIYTEGEEVERGQRFKPNPVEPGKSVYFFDGIVAAKVVYVVRKLDGEFEYEIVPDKPVRGHLTVRVRRMKISIPNSVNGKEFMASAFKYVVVDSKSRPVCSDGALEGTSAGGSP